jgi:hypothetical protein
MAVLAAILPAACSLDPGGALLVGEGAGDATAPVRPPLDASVMDERPGDTGSPRDVTTPEDVVSPIDAPAVTFPLDTGAADAVEELPVTNCDQDGDGYLAQACGGNDCCDIDALAYPGEEAYSTFPTNCGTWDFNCDGTIELLYATVACSGHGGGCGGSGIAAPGTCGGTFAAQTCAWSPPACLPEDTGTTEQQACQ